MTERLRQSRLRLRQVESKTERNHWIVRNVHQWPKSFSSYRLSFHSACRFDIFSLESLVFGKPHEGDVAFSFLLLNFQPLNKDSCVKTTLLDSSHRLVFLSRVYLWIVYLYVNVELLNWAQPHCSYWLCEKWVGSYLNWNTLVIFLIHCSSLVHCNHSILLMLWSISSALI